MTKEEQAVEEEKARAAAQEQAEKDAADKKAEEEASELENKMKALEDEKNKAIEEAANWKIAALKAKGKAPNDDEDETEDERIARLVAENLAKNKVAHLESEKAKLLEQALKENKELKLAQLHGKKEPPAAQGGHSEGQSVRDTLVTKEQEAAFKSRGWSDKDIERYKKNLQRYGTR